MMETTINVPELKSALSLQWKAEKNPQVAKSVNCE